MCRAVIQATPAALLIFLLAPGASGQRLSQNDLKNSEWDTTYVTSSGQRVRAKLFFRGSSGSYSIPGATGRLYNIRYNFDTGGGGPLWYASINGNWSLGGSSGRFSFGARNDQHPIRFDGRWGYGSDDYNGGSWDGRFVRVSQSSGGRGHSGGISGNHGHGPQVSPLGRQFYTAWKWDPQNRRYYAYYCFKSSPFAPDYKKQLIVHYPYDHELRNYVFYYNMQKKKYWGRCCSQHHPQYDPQVMVWNFASDAPPGKNWGPLTKGDPPIPGSTDRVGMAMVPDAPPPPR